MTTNKNAARAGQSSSREIESGEESTMTSMTEADEVREAVLAWVDDLERVKGQLAAEMLAQDEFLDWANAQIAQGPWTMDDCVEATLRRSNYTDRLPDFPRAITPEWAVEVDSDWAPLGGEIAVYFLGRKHESGGAWARLRSGAFVVSDAAEGAEHNGPRLNGDVVPFDDGQVGIDWSGLQEDTVTPNELIDAARVLHKVSHDLHAARGVGRELRRPASVTETFEGRL